MQLNDPLVPANSRLRGNKLWRPFLLLLCVWALVLVPSALVCQWFTLDMGGVFDRAAEFPANVMWVLSPYVNGGRYFPVYWLYQISLFKLFSTNLAPHYIAQAALFMVSLSLTSYLFLRITDSRAATVTFGVLACLGGAVSENLYTVGKGEPLAYLFTVSAIALFYRRQAVARTVNGACMASIALLVALAIWSKETSLVLLVFAPGALGAHWFIERTPIRAFVRSAFALRYFQLALAVAAGWLLSKVPYLLLPKVGDFSTYVDYTIDAQLVSENLLFYAVQQPEVLATGLASLIFIGRIAWRMRYGPDHFKPKARSDFAFICGLLAISWGYYAGLLIWRWPMGYYMLLPSIIFKFTALYGLIASLRMGLLSRGAAWTSLGFLSLVFAYSILHSWYVVTSQSSYSRMYTEAINKYLEVAPKSSRLILESFPFYAEQVWNTIQIMQLVAHENHVVGGIADLVDPAVATPDIIKLLRISRARLEGNEVFFPREGDFLLLITGNKLGTWSVRGATPLYSDDSVLLKQNAFDMVPVAENKIFTVSAYLNTWTYRFNLGPTYIGYKLYKVTSKVPRLLWRGRYPDGWIGKSAYIRLFPDFGRRAKVTMSTPSFNSPNYVTVLKNGKPIRDVQLIEGREYSFDVDNDAQSDPTKIEFVVQRTVVPKSLQLNRDSREIGVLVRVEPHN